MKLQQHSSICKAHMGNLSPFRRASLLPPLYRLGKIKYVFSFSHILGLALGLELQLIQRSSRTTHGGKSPSGEGTWA